MSEPDAFPIGPVDWVTVPVVGVVNAADDPLWMIHPKKCCPQPVEADDLAAKMGALE